MKISFFVPGIPASGGSKKGFIRGGKVCIVDDAVRNKDWRASVALAGAEAFGERALLNEPLEVSFAFVFPRLESDFGTGRNAGRLKASAPRHHMKTPDLLKIARSTEDALTSIIWKDDKTTVDLTLSKRYGERPGVMITVWTKEGG